MFFQVIAYMACIDKLKRLRDAVRFVATRMPDLQLKRYEVAFKFEDVK